MPFHPAKAYMDKLDAATAAPMARLREQTGAGSSTTLRDRLDMARGKTGVEKRWAATGGGKQGEEEDESNVTPVRAQGRAPPPPPASRIGSAGPPPPPPSRGSAPPPPSRGAAPPPPARGAAPPPPARGAAAPSLPPRMANESGTPHPPPAYGAAVAPPPPPPRTNSAASGVSVGQQQELFKWSTISEEDKQAFFEMLDEFFTSRVSLSHTPPPRRTGDATHVVAPRIPAGAAAANKPASSAAVAEIPSLSASSHAGDAVPLAWAASLFFQERTDAAWGGAAPWFTQHATPPPPLAQRKDLVWRGQYSYSGAQRTLVGAAAFEDLSALWYRVSWTQPSSPRVELAWRRAPAALGAEALQAGSAAYGELVACFAERAEAAQQHVGDGECWTLAHEALLHANSEGGFAEHERCFEGIGRTHGHLIYAATPAGGRWRGGDLSRAEWGGVRRGDVLEWREARCSVVDAPRGSYMDIGAPEHTAVVVKDAPVPREMEYEEDGCEMHPHELEPIEVIEQSARELPTRRTYDLATFTRGQLWIYRPVAEHGYTGGAVTAAWPPVGERIEPIA